MARTSRIVSGLRVGRLTVLDCCGPGRVTKWTCRCVCGRTSAVSANVLRQGVASDCRCEHEQHGLSKTVEYGIWCGIKNRCENPRVKGFPLYGGRGIRIADEWRHDFPAFLAHIGPRPSPKHSVDRIDGAGHYEPGNVRWATSEVQTNNRACTRRVIYRGEEMALADAVRLAGSVIHREAAWVRIRTGWAVERALETPRLFESPAADYWRNRPAACDGEVARRSSSVAALPAGPRSRTTCKPRSTPFAAR